MFKRKYLKLLSCHLLNKKVKFHSIRHQKDDILFRFEYEGSFLKEYYMAFKDSVLVVKVNNGNLIYRDNKTMVFSLANQTLCILKS